MFDKKVYSLLTALSLLLSNAVYAAPGGDLNLTNKASLVSRDNYNLNLGTEGDDDIVIIQNNARTLHLDGTTKKLTLDGALAVTGATTLSGAITLPNATYLKAVDAAGTGTLDLLNADATDDTVLNAKTGETVKLSIGGVTEAVLNTTAFSANAVAGNALGTLAIPWLSAFTGKIAIDADITSVTGANVGITAAQNFSSDSGAMALIGYGANTSGALMQVFKTRATTTDANTVVVSGDTLFQLTAYGSDGDTYSRAAQILITNSATPGDGDMPGTIDFQTSPDGSASPASVLSLNHAKLATFTGQITSTATSDLGWSAVNAADQACNTTCTSACVFGMNTGALGAFVGCADATADTCICAGAS